MLLGPAEKSLEGHLLFYLKSMMKLLKNGKQEK